MNRSLQDVGIDTSTMKIDVDTIMTGKPKSLRDKLQVVLDLIIELQKDTGLAEESIIINEATKRGILEEEARRILAQLQREGTIYSPKEGYFRKT
jgi:replicative DNA helicase Mcm